MTVARPDGSLHRRKKRPNFPAHRPSHWKGDGQFRNYVPHRGGRSKSGSRGWIAGRPDVLRPAVGRRRPSSSGRRNPRSLSGYSDRHYRNILDRARKRGVNVRPTYAERRRHRSSGPSGIGTRRPTSAQKSGQRRMLEYRRRRSSPVRSRRRQDVVRSRRKQVHRTRDKSLPMWERFGQSERSWKGMSRKQRLKVRKRQEWERRKSFLRKNPSKFRGGIMMGVKYRNGRPVGAFAGNKLDKKGRLEQFIKHKDRQFRRGRR